MIMYLATELIKLHILCNTIAIPIWRFFAIAQKNKDIGSLLQFLPPQPSHDKRMGNHQYCSPPDSIEKNPT